MAIKEPIRFTNRLLGSLSKPDIDLLHPHLEPIKLCVAETIVTAGTPVEHAYFPESGIVTLLACGSSTHKIDTCIYGREGMSGYPLLLATDRCTHHHRILLAGTGYRIATSSFLAAIRQSESLRQLLLRYVCAFLAQSTHTTLANNATLERRLAWRLLMCHDRIDGDVIPITHQALSIMLGVRRAGVTEAIHILEGKGLVQAARGKIVIRRRAGLESLAGSTYGRPEREYDRLIAAA